MKKKLILLATCLMMATAFVSCTADVDDTDQQIEENRGTTDTDNRKPPRKGGNLGG